MNNLKTLAFLDINFTSQQRSIIMKTNRFLLAAIFMVLALTSAYGAGNPALVGRWLPEGGGRVPRGFPDDLELFKDGTGIIDKISVKWKVDKNRFIVTSSSVGFAFNYTVSGKMLTLIDDNNNKTAKYFPAAYVKQQNEAAAVAAKKAAEDAAAAEAARKAAEDAARAAEVEAKKESMTDNRDDKSYKTIKIGSQTWMAENLNYEAEGSKCYGNNPSNCDMYGRLYNWETAREACPQGWHLPSDAEWTTLTDYVSPSPETKLKAMSGWNNNGRDTYGFAALPGGFASSDGSFDTVGSFGFWWSSTQINATNAYNRYIYGSSSNVSRNRNYSVNKSYYYSVRCVKDD
jgi:uncharacterized protein (TIGR02145 family)